MVDAHATATDFFWGIDREEKCEWILEEENYRSNSHLTEWGNHELGQRLSAPNHVQPNFEPTIFPFPPLIFVLVLFYYLFYFYFYIYIFISFLASSSSTSSPVKHTRPLVAVLKSSHSCSFFSFVADEDLRGRNVLLLTSFSRYVNCSDTPEKVQ